MSGEGKDFIDLLIAVGGLLGGGLGTHLFLNKKYKAEASATITGESLKLVQTLQQEMVTIKKDVIEIRAENLVMHKQLAVIEAENITLREKVKSLEAERVTLLDRVKHLEAELENYKNRKKI